MKTAESNRRHGRCIFSLVTLLTLSAAMLLSGCSTTSRLAPDEILYNGVKKVEINRPDTLHSLPPVKIPSGVKSELKDAVDVPANYLSVFGFKLPIPLGLWVYNHWDNPEKGLKHWMYEKLVQEPVLVSDVRPEVRVRMLEQILDNNGYFSGHAGYSLVSGKNKRKAKILYDINTGPAYTLDSIILLPDTCHLHHLIDSVAGVSPYLKPGERYSTDSLSTERIRITNAVRNHGYYFFKPEYIEYLADSTITPRQIALKLTLASTTPRAALRRYRTGSVTTYIYRNKGGAEAGYDTISTSRGTVIREMPSRLREKLIPECVTFREGKYFSVRDMNRTQTRLSRLGIFNGIDIVPLPDTIPGHEDILNIVIGATFDTPLEASLEVNASSKSNSYIGPGLTFGVTNRNLFGGGEQLNVSLTGSYEWQTGKKSERSSVFNSYEFGVSASLAFPRLLAPRFVPRSRRDINWTRITLNGDILNRPHYFKMAQVNMSFAYDWRLNRHATNTLTLFKLTYTNLMKTTTVFDSIMDANQAIAQSFRSQFIPQLSYTYTYDRAFGRDNTLNWTFTVQEAGNLFWCIYQAAGKKHEKELFGTPFSQFVKGSCQLVYGRRIFSGDNWLMTRVAVGAAHAYGNSTQVPYSEQFYVGGANSVRAFTVRSIGPGSYRAPSGQRDGYFDQTGTFKFEANVEYRFPLFGPLHGALFLDAGNVWLLKNDPERPGGTLRAKSFLRDLALGTGVGVRLDISMLVVRLDLGVGIHAPYDTGKSGYYNMTSFGNSLALHLAIGYPF